MRDSFPFLTRLGLRPDADAKDIRRAYARELKQIDQAADPGGFQELRAAYEAALEWHAYRQSPQDGGQDVAATDQAPEPAQDEVPANPAPEPVAEIPPLDLREQAMPTDLEPIPLHQPGAESPSPEDPAQLADQAFEKFIADIARKNEYSAARRLAVFKAALLSSLNSELLLNLTARILFEGRIVGLFAAGAKPGHEALFAVANEVFEWERDRRRIQQFGQAGAMISRAVDERQLFQSMPGYGIGTYKQLLRIVRATPQPGAGVSRDDLELFQQLASRFHTWFSLILERETLDNWLEAARPDAQKRHQAPEPEETAWLDPASESIWRRPIISTIALMAIVLMIGFLNLIIDARRPKGFYPPADKHEMRSTQEDADMPPSQERIEEIRSRIDYKWPAHTASGVYNVVYKVFIDADGTVLGMNKVQASGNKGYDAAVEKAIRETARFPQGTQTVFRLRFGVDFTKRETPQGDPP
ncbi:TonB C-terminal domain-containing protein [Pseudoduganella violaceinigra]|uniref:TonB C-terminal domain-containing protein n=1 Tax=Pseudoduganella violaceinigra TaxID=246602 RepID=UPI00041728A0|nr:TonB C-terminal domain-containing protein [Pseudoduganella violaceinigra]